MLRQLLEGCRLRFARRPIAWCLSAIAAVAVGQSDARAQPALEPFDNLPCIACICDLLLNDDCVPAGANRIERIARAYLDESCPCSGEEGDCHDIAVPVYDFKVMTLSLVCAVYINRGSLDCNESWTCADMVEAATEILDDVGQSMSVCDLLGLLVCADCITLPTTPTCQDYKDAMETFLGRSLTACEEIELELCACCDECTEDSALLLGLLCEYAHECAEEKSCEEIVDGASLLLGRPLTDCEEAVLIICSGCAEEDPEVLLDAMCEYARNCAVFTDCEDMIAAIEAMLGRELTECEEASLILCSGCTTELTVLTLALCEYAEECEPELDCLALIAAVEALMDRELTACEISEIITCSACAEDCLTDSESGLKLAFDTMSCDRDGDTDVDCDDLKDAIKDSLLCNGVICGRGTCDNEQGGSGGEVIEGQVSMAQMAADIACAWFAAGNSGSAPCEPSITCEELLECIQEVLTECSPEGQEATLSAEQVAQLLECTGCSFDCLDENSQPLDCDALPCPIPDMDGDGDVDDIDLILVIEELTQCCSGDSESPFHDGLTSSELEELLCDHLEECEGATAVTLAGTALSLPHDLGLSSTPRYDGPVAINWINGGGRSIGSSDYRLVTSGDYDPNDLEFTLQSTPTGRWGELGLSITRHNLAGMVQEHEVWHDVEGEHAGLASRSYITRYTYDELGRLTAHTSANGTITEYVHDVLNRTTAVWIGKVPGDGGSEPVEVARYYYDDPNVGDGPDQGVGNGNLNYIRALDGTGNRDTKRFFDYRDRLYKALNPTTPYEFLVYDNLDRVVERGVFKSEPSAIDDPLADRGLYSTTSYSQRGMVYRQQVAVDATESSPWFLESHTWYDAVGRPAARWGPNAPATKTRYDAHGRATLVALTDRGLDAAPGDTDNHADALSLDDDIVLEQVEYAYTDTGRVDTVITSYRHHDDDSTDGELDDTIAIQTFMGYMYDAAQRPIRTLNYGTNSGSDIFANGTFPSWPLGSVPSDWNTLPAGNPIMTGVVYNDRGLVEDVIDPLGRLTRTFYDDISRRIAVVENYEDAGLEWDGDADLPRWQATGVDSGEHDQDRVTAFVYDGAGNVTQQIAFLPTGGASTVQVTQYAYGTTVTTSGTMDSMVASGDLLAAVHYPNESSGEADDDAEYTVSYAYNQLGELIGVTDQNGTRHEYTRDAAGRVTIDQVGNFGPGIDDSVQSLTVEYDDFGRMERVRSWDDVNGTGDVLNAVKFTYTTLWQVEEVFQDPDSDIDTGTPIGTETARVAYGYQPGSNSSRLVYEIYPDNATHKALDYGGASVNGWIHRPSGISSSAGPLVEYSYLGMGMFAVTDYPVPDVQLDRTLSPDGKRNAVGHTDQDSGVYPGFDKFGRVKFHAWVDGDLTQHATPGGPDRPFLFAESYGYDTASNRKHKDTVQPVAGQNWNHVDWHYTYDGLDRLIEAKRGVWGGSSLSSTAAGSQKWSLDMLGNWSDFRQDLDGNGAYTDSADLIEGRTHNAANEIESIAQTEPASATRPFAYDKAGNMTEQKLRSGEGTGTRTYVHDAWNRLVRVELDHDGLGTGDAAFVIARYEYNPLHWRTVKVADVRAPSSNPTTAPSRLQRRVMYYNASWQLIEEHICDDWDLSEGGDVNRIGQLFWGLRYIDDLVFRREDRNLTNEPYPAEDPAEPDWEETETPSWYALSDVQFSVVALITPTALVAERVVYDPYGRARQHHPTDYDGNGDATITDLYAFMSARTAGDIQADWERDGDVDVADLFAYLAVYTPYLSPVVDAGRISWEYTPGGISPLRPDNPIGYCGYVFNPETDDYTVRFRHYDPEIGRWLERDPFEFIDGMNLVTYARNSPMRYNDPVGLDAGWARRGSNDPWLASQDLKPNQCYPCEEGMIRTSREAGERVFSFTLANSLAGDPSRIEDYKKSLNISATWIPILMDVGNPAGGPRSIWAVLRALRDAIINDRAGAPIVRAQMKDIINSMSNAEKNSLVQSIGRLESMSMDKYGVNIWVQTSFEICKCNMSGNCTWKASHKKWYKCSRDSNTFEPTRFLLSEATPVTLNECSISAGNDAVGDIDAHNALNKEQRLKAKFK